MTEIDVELYKYTKLFERIQNAKKEWNDGEHVRTYFSGTFYNGVYGMQHLFSGYVSKDAFNSQKNKTTRDHFLSARLVFRAMMAEYPELLHDFDGLHQLVKDCQTTIKITRVQNNGSIKFRVIDEAPRINALTIDKYDSFGWYHPNHGFLMEYAGGGLVPKPFPLKHMVPDWLTQFEKKLLKSSK